MSDDIYADIYFAGQRLRRGVTRSMVREAIHVLDWPLDRLRDRALERLRVLHGKHVTWEWLAEQPLVDRRHLVDAAQRQIAVGNGRRIDVRKTSGSTGTPFRFPKDRVMTSWMDAAMWAEFSWHGIEPGQAHVRFWGMPLQRHQRIKKLAVDALLHRQRISAFDLSEARVRDQFRSMLSLRPRYAIGYPTLMKAFIELCRQEGLHGGDLDLDVVISTGELLSPVVRKELAEFFDCRVVDEYGCTESGDLAFECGHGTLHLIPIAAWPEVVAESGQPAPEGEAGELVVSDLYGPTFPLLRYRLHDCGTLSMSGCPCGRSLPRLDVRSGRSGSFIETPRGKVYSAILAYTVPQGVLRFKVRQVTSTQLQAQIVPGHGFVEGVTDVECRKRWEEALGPGMEVDLDTVEDIPLEPSGKLRYFVPLSAHRRE